MAKRTRQPVQASPFEMQTPPTFSTVTTHSSHCPPTAAPPPQGGAQSRGMHTPSPSGTSWATPSFGQHHGREGQPHPPPVASQSDPLWGRSKPTAPTEPSSRDQVSTLKVDPCWCHSSAACVPVHVVCMLCCVAAPGSDSAEGEAKGGVSTCHHCHCTRRDALEQTNGTSSHFV